MIDIGVRKSGREVLVPEPDPGKNSGLEIKSVGQYWKDIGDGRGRLIDTLTQVCSEPAVNFSVRQLMVCRFTRQALSTVQVGSFEEGRRNQGIVCVCLVNAIAVSKVVLLRDLYDLRVVDWKETRLVGTSGRIEHRLEEAGEVDVNISSSVVSFSVSI